MRRALLALSIAAVLAAGCDRGCTATKKSLAIAESPSAADLADIERRTAKLSGDIVKEAFADPAVKAKQDAVWAKVFVAPDIAKDLQDLGSGVIADPAVKARFDPLIQAVMQDPAVVARLKAIAATASSQAEAQEKIEKLVSSTMESPAIANGINHGVEAVVAAPAVEARLSGIFEGADVGDLVSSSMKDPELVRLSKDLDDRLAKVVGEGKAESYYADWAKAARANPAVGAAARDFANEAVEGLAGSEDLRGTLKGGLESARTKSILASATADMLADPDVASNVRDFFRAIFAGDQDASGVAKKIDALFASPMLQKRLESAILELLSSKIGAARLQSSVMSGMKTPASKKKLTEFLVLLLQAAPKR